MVVKIIPAVLAGRIDQFRQRWHLAQRLHPLIHLDLMDGVFVPTKSITPKQLKSIRFSTPIECHLMVSRPEDWLEGILRFRLERVILPVELRSQLRPLIALFRSRKIPVSLAINPTTPLSRLTPWFRFIESVTVMGVAPGRYGAPVWPGIIPRLQRLRRRWPKLKLAIDGGLRPESLQVLLPFRPARLVVGSSVMLAQDPFAAYKNFQTKLTTHAG